MADPGARERVVSEPPAEVLQPVDDAPGATRVGGGVDVVAGHHRVGERDGGVLVAGLAEQHDVGVAAHRGAQRIGKGRDVAVGVAHHRGLVGAGNGDLHRILDAQHDLPAADLFEVAGEQRGEARGLARAHGACEDDESAVDAEHAPDERDLAGQVAELGEIGGTKPRVGGQAHRDVQAVVIGVVRVAQVHLAAHAVDVDVGDELRVLGRVRVELALAGAGLDLGLVGRAHHLHAFVDGVHGEAVHGAVDAQAHDGAGGRHGDVDVARVALHGLAHRLLETGEDLRGARAVGGCLIRRTHIVQPVEPADDVRRGGRELDAARIEDEVHVIEQPSPSTGVVRVGSEATRHQDHGGFVFRIELAARVGDGVAGMPVGRVEVAGLRGAGDELRDRAKLGLVLHVFERAAGHVSSRPAGVPRRRSPAPRGSREWRRWR